LHRYAYTLTTLGTVLLAKAAHGAQVKVDDFYRRAYEAFQAASEDDARNLVVWLAFLRHSLDVLKRVYRDGRSESAASLEERLNGDWISVYESMLHIANQSESVANDLRATAAHYRALKEKGYRRNGD
jgi:hypothetical protein